MSVLSQLAAEIAASVSSAPLTQLPDDASSASSDQLSTPISAPRPTRLRSSPAAVVASALDNGDDDSLCLSSTPPPFVAPDMLDSAPSIEHLSVMPWSEQQQCREQLMRTPGLYASWCMRRIVSMYSDSARNEFNEHLLAGRVTKFELVFAYLGLRREVSCLYTIVGIDATFREVPLRTPHVHFCEDGQEVDFVEGTPAWHAMHRYFNFKFMPYLLLATAKPMRQTG